MANTYKFQDIVEETKELFNLETIDLPSLHQTPDALDYLRTQIKRLNKMDGNKLMSSSSSHVFTRRILPGRMYMWKYANPIYKMDTKKLPYYDIFPVGFILTNNGSYFTALNLHYIPPMERAYLMDAFWKFTLRPDSNNWLTRLNKNIYTYMKIRFSMRWYAPCIKRYSMSRIPGRLMMITPDHWDIMMQIPCAIFRRASINRVYRESRIVMRENLRKGGSK
jgi:hypothetical protein